MAGNSRNKLINSDQLSAPASEVQRTALPSRLPRL